MKGLILVAFTVFYGGIAGEASAQSTSNRVNPNWNTNSHWTANAPRYDTSRSGILAHNSNVTGNPFIINNGHTITINAGATLTTNETFTIKEGGTLIINGTLRGTGSGKEFKIEKGTLIINAGGVLDWAGYWTSDDEPSTITIDGFAEIGGNMSVKVDINGSGNIEVDGTLNNDGGSIFGCSSSGSGCCAGGGGCLLPIELAYFDAELIDNLIFINWATLSEINNELFTIYRSSATSLWEEIGTLPGAGNSDELVEYEFVDHSFPNSLLYYQLKQTDYDGAYSYSPMVVVEPAKADSEVKLYPNPAQDLIRLTYKAQDSEKFHVLDSQGKYMNITPIIRSNTVEFDISQLPTGSYFVCIQGLESKASYQFIKK